MTPQEILKHYFGYDNFRLYQEEVIVTALKGHDSLVIMPTGGGKSICYQIPAMIFDGVTVVVSPLIALMKDQVDSLKANGVPAEFLNSSLSYVAQKSIIQRVRSGEVKILYVAPERISEEGSLAALTGDIKVSLIAIDEAHCISHWGHDFRPDYLVLGNLKSQFPNVPVMALTASADQITRDDIAKQLNLSGDNRFISSFNRPNISYYIYRKDIFDDFIPVYLEKNKDSSGIIYCLSRKSTEELADRLNAAGYNAACYHAGLERDMRSKVQEDFIHDRVRIIVATIAFGMGIDKSDVRFVIHADLPKNIESYYQETGRAGRDGMPSDAILFYSRSDVTRLSYFISNENKDHAEIMYRKLDQMAAYAESPKCRRQMILNYFNEEHHGKCNSCDFCLTNYEDYDGTIQAQMALSAIVRLKERFGMKTVIDFLRGSNAQKITSQMREIRTYGIGKGYSEEEWKDVIGQMLNNKMIEVSNGQYPTLSVTDLGWSVLKNETKANFLKPVETKTKITISQETHIDQLLLAELKKLRKAIADREHVPPYIVLSDVTLMELVTYLPFENEDLNYITGFGDYKIARYGSDFIGCIKQYCLAKGIASRMLSNKNKSSLRKKARKKQPLQIKLTSPQVSLNMYNAGMKIGDIAKERGINEDTIKGHLATFIPSGEIKINELVAIDKIEPIMEAIRINGILSPGRLKEELGNDYTYSEINAVIEYRSLEYKEVH